MPKYDPIAIAHYKDRASAAQDDTVGLLLAKLVSIVEERDAPFHRLMEEVMATSQRAEGVIFSLIGIVEQYAEGTPAGFLGLCHHMANRMVQQRLHLPDGGRLEERWK